MCIGTWPKNFPGLGTGAQRFADKITAATDGRITVKPYGAGELAPPFASFDAAQDPSLIHIPEPTGPDQRSDAVF